MVWPYGGVHAKWMAACQVGTNRGADAWCCRLQSLLLGTESQRMCGRHIKVYSFKSAKISFSDDNKLYSPVSRFCSESTWNTALEGSFQTDFKFAR